MRGRYLSWRSMIYRLRSITNSNTAREKYLQIAQLDHCAVDAVGTLQRLSSTFFVTFLPSRPPQSRLERVCSREEGSRGPWESNRFYEPSKRLLRTPRSGQPDLL